jgi:GR25 family glycosyltransferase involved in LPS biosynthesis
MFNNIYITNNNIPIYCINLERSKDRWKKVQKKFKNIKLNKFLAVDGSKLNESDIDYSIIKSDYKTDVNALCDSKIKPGLNLKLSKGEFGCSLSHYNLWKKIVDENISICIIIEDDINPTNNFNNYKKLLNELPNDWDIAYISFLCTGKKNYINSTKTIYKPVCGFTTAGYIINKKGAEKLLKLLPIEGPIDLFLLSLFKNNKINAYVMEGICNSDNTWGGNDSSIEHSTRNINKFIKN